MTNPRRRKGPTPRRTAALAPLKDPILILHEMRPQDSFDETAKILFTMIKQTAEKHPDNPRVLHFLVDGHRNTEGGFDEDSWELMRNFIPGVLGEYLTEYRCPLIEVRMSEPQSNHLPHQLEIFSAEGDDRTTLITALTEQGLEVYDADKEDA